MPLLTTGVFVASGPRPGLHAALQAGPRPAGAAAAGARGAARRARFSPAERNRLLLERGIGPTTVERLECAGYASLDALRAAGVQQVVAAVVEAVDTPGWRNRLRALERVLRATELR